MNVLWNLREDFRCVRIDALDLTTISEVAEEIIGCSSFALLGSVWHFLKLFAGNKMIWLFGALCLF
jgi:hypothetical protein